MANIVDFMNKWMQEQNKHAADIRHRRLDLEEAEDARDIDRAALPFGLQQLMLEQREKGPQAPSQGGTGPGGGEPVTPMQVPDSPVNMGAASANLSALSRPPAPTQPGMVQPGEQRPGYTADVRVRPRRGVFGQRLPPERMVSYQKNQALIDEHATNMALAKDSALQGYTTEGTDLANSQAAARAELGPFAAEAIAKSNRELLGIRHRRAIVEKESREATYEVMREKGAPHEMAMAYARAETLEEKGEAIRGWESNSAKADRLLMENRQLEQKVKLRQLAESDAELHRMEMERQRKGLAGALGLRRTEEEVGQSLTEAQGAFRAALKEGGEGGDVGAMLPQIQGNIAALSGDEWFKTSEDWGEDKFKAYKTNDIMIKLAEVDGRWVEEGLTREQALKRRRDAVAWLEKIHGMPKFREVTVEGRLEIILDGYPEGVNAIRLNEILLASKHHEAFELQQGRAIRDFDFSPRPMISRKEPDLGDPMAEGTGFRRTPEEAEAQPYIYPHLPPKVKETLETRERLRRGLRKFIFGNRGQGE
jgi:hypothetical protein